MKKLLTLNIFTITFTIFFYLANYLLLRDNALHISISSIISDANQMTGQSHLIVLALLPIYIATMIFGASLLGIYTATTLQHFFFNRTKNPKKLKSTA